MTHGTSLTRPAFIIGTVGLATLVMATNCSHPDTGMATTGAGTSSVTPGAGTSSTPGAGTSSTTGGGGAGSMGGANSMGGNVVIIGEGGGMDRPMPMACAADANQQHALPYTPGYVIDPTAKKNADDQAAALDYNAQIRQLMGVPTLNQYNDIFRTPDDGDIKGFEFRDGPRGVNLDPVKGGGNGYATLYPVPMARGASFDVDLENKIGVAMGDELIASGATMLLAPTVNILRHPGWGRAQETYGEDSFMLGRLGSAVTAGIQEFAPACVKHYAANNIEKGRGALTAKMDEQTLQEVYARHFGMIIQDGGVACVMAAYNLVDSPTGGKFKSTQSKHLLTTILRTQYGFQGMVLSDWWAMPGANGAISDPDKQANSKGAVQAGMDMELPWAYNFPALASQPLQADVKTSVTRVLETKWRFKVASKTGARGLKTPVSTFDPGTYSVTHPDHLVLAEQAALEGTVLLKNEGNILPIPATAKTVAVVGPNVAWKLQGTNSTGTVKFANDARLGDLGSSRANADPAKQVGPCQGFKNQKPADVNVVCSDDTGSLADAKTKAMSADFVVVVAGLTPEDEGEEYTITPEDSDRGANLQLDGKSAAKIQNDFISQIAALGKPTVVILEGGSAIDVSPFFAQVKGLVMAWYPGMRGGDALGKLFFGKANFSGKLPITWPAALADEPVFSGNGGDPQTTVMDYYLGYRWFDTQGKKPLFPFGHGLSYTKFEYSNLYVPCTTVPATGVVNVEVDIKNTGTVDGDETAFLFVQYPGSTVPKRVATYKELKGFQRANVPAGKAVRVKIPLRISDLWYWDDAAKKQTVATGEVKVLVGGNSLDLTQMGSFTVM